MSIVQATAYFGPPLAMKKRASFEYSLDYEVYVEALRHRPGDLVVAVVSVRIFLEIQC